MTTQAQSARLKKKFLDAFALRGVVIHAAEQVGCGRRTVYNWLGDDPEFAAGFAEAEIASTERLESEIYRRAHDGVTREKGIYYEGQQIATEIMTEYADTLAMFILKARKPNVYRDNSTVEHKGQITVEYVNNWRSGTD